MFAKTSTLLALLVLLSTLDSCRADINQTIELVSANLTACLKASVPATNLVMRTNVTFNASRTAQNAAINSNPFAIVNVRGLKELQAVLACSRTFKVRAVARGGGHSFEGNSVQSNTIVIDMSYLSAITINQGGWGEPTTATIQAGAWLGDVYTAFNKAGLGFPGGRCPSVGISGYLLGAGHGAWSRALGMGCDSVLSFNMVTWQGELITVNATNTHKGLFWASCGGGGGNFGIVTSWTVKPFTPPAQVQYAAIDYPPEESVDVFDYFHRNAYLYNSRINPKISYGGGKPYFRLSMYSLGQDSLKRFIPGTKLDDLSPDNIVYQNMSWINAVVQSAAGIKDPSQLTDRAFWKSSREAFKEKSFMLYSPLSKSAISKVLAHYALYPMGTLNFYPYGGAIAAVNNTATAFPHRQGVLGLMQAKATWEASNATAKAAAMDWINELEMIMINNMNQTYYSYINYLDSELNGKWRKAYYGSNYNRLKQVKAIYDPNNFFTFPKTYIRPTFTSPCEFNPCI